MNCAVFDLEKGCVLKLDDNKTIMNAVSGFTVLTNEQISELYGQE